MSEAEKRARGREGHEHPELDLAQLKKWMVIESRKLGGERVLIVSDKHYLEEAQAAHPDLTMYFPNEVRELLVKGGAPMLCRKIHMFKTVFDGTILPGGGSG